MHRNADSKQRRICFNERGCSLMDALIFVLILATLMAMWRGKRRLAGLLFAVSLVAVWMLFKHHATDALPINL
jgi:hypothetical protein